MAIYKKDGSKYTLKGPNPLMKDQKRWDDEEEDDIEVFNFDRIKSNKIKDTTQKTKKMESKLPLEIPDENYSRVRKIDKEEIHHSKIEVLQPEEVTTLPPVTSTTTVPPDTPQSHYRKMDTNYLNCLPAEIRVTEDKLYDEVRTEVSYQSPFRLEAVIVQNQDLRFDFWTTINLVTVGSIIYHPDYRRWWKVENIYPTAENDGFVATCTVSELQPDFS